MSAVDLIIIGLLRKKNMSPYDLTQYIEIRGMKSIVKISDPSIYKKVILLQKKGYLDVYSEKQSELPEKKIYSVTSEGEKYFYQLMKSFSESIFRVHFEFNAFFAFLGEFKKEEGLSLMKNFENSLAKGKKQVEQVINTDKERKDFPPFPLSGKAILNQQLRIYDTLLEWIEDFRKKYSKS